MEPNFLDEDHLNHPLSLLINERTLFENQLYDYLLQPVFIDESIFIDESFWEPVKIGYNNVKELNDIITEDDCPICTDKHLNFKNLHCCNQKLCNGCCYIWFENSVKCPYCYQDLREFNLKKINN